jgi:hypothetical protein
MNGQVGAMGPIDSVEVDHWKELNILSGIPGIGPSGLDENSLPPVRPEDTLIRTRRRRSGSLDMIRDPGTRVHIN